MIVYVRVYVCMYVCICRYVYAYPALNVSTTPTFLEAATLVRALKARLSEYFCRQARLTACSVSAH